MTKEGKARAGECGEVYLRVMARRGALGNLAMVVLSFGPAMVLAMSFGVLPPLGTILAGFASIVAVTGAFWIVEPLSYFPILGIPGISLAFLSGNVANLRLPGAIAAQEAGNAAPGSGPGVVLGTIGVAGSTITNLAILTAGAALMDPLLGILPPGLRDAFDALLPAMFGALFVQFALRRRTLGLAALAIAGVGTYLLRMGHLGFLPGDPTYAAILISVFGTIAFARRLEAWRNRASPRREA